MLPTPQAYNLLHFDTDTQHHYLSSGKKQPIKPRVVVLGNLLQVTLPEHRAGQQGTSRGPFQPQPCWGKKLLSYQPMKVFRKNEHIKFFLTLVNGIAQPFLI